MQSGSTKVLINNVKIFFCDSVSGTINADHHVDVAESKVGKELISDGFEPCLAVFAILKNNEYGIYHALTLAYGDPLKKFVASIKDNVEMVLVFQKSYPEANAKKAPYLVVNLARELDCKVKRIHVDVYTGIYVNANDKEVVLFKKHTYKRNSNETKLIYSDKKEIAFQPIGIRKSVAELYKMHKNNYELCEQGVIVANDVIITEKLGSELFKRTDLSNKPSIEVNEVIEDTEVNSTTTNKDKKCCKIL